MTEESILANLKRYTRGIGDDCAVLKPPTSKQDMLLTTDYTIEDVHFTRDWSAERVGHKAIARSLSDIAAMGGKPLYCLVSIALATWVDQPWMNGFYRGATDLLEPTKAWIAGGDISHAKQLVVSVTICGAMAKGKSLLRWGAKPGDMIYVSGPLGGWKNKTVIEPRLDLGRKLVGKASACMDITDGLAMDLHKMGLMSKVAATLESVPLLPGATLEQALYDGEDYELLYTAPSGVRVPGIRIGAITTGKAGFMKYEGKPLEPIGYDHLLHRT